MPKGTNITISKLRYQGLNESCGQVSRRRFPTEPSLDSVQGADHPVKLQNKRL